MTTKNNIAKLHVTRKPKGPVRTSDVLSRVSYLNEGQLALVQVFIQQILMCHDPDTVKSFVELRQDPRLGSILSIASDLGEEEREQLLFIAEEIFHQQQAEEAHQIGAA